MEKIRVEAHGDVGLLRMDSGTTNAIGEQLVLQLQEKIDDAAKRFKAIVLAGNKKFFSIGLDLPGLMPLNRSEMTEFWHRFHRAVFDLYTLPLPTVCAVSGHAIAGGTILSLTCDYRLAAEGKLKFGLNEVTIGVPVPYLSDMILRELIGERAATDMIYKGNLISVTDARENGLVDAVYPPETVEEEALSLALKLASLPHPAFSAVKANRVEQVRQRYESRQKDSQETFIDCWFNESTRGVT